MHTSALCVHTSLHIQCTCFRSFIKLYLRHYPQMEGPKYGDLPPLDLHTCHVFVVYNYTESTGGSLPLTECLFYTCVCVRVRECGCQATHGLMPWLPGISCVVLYLSLYAPSPFSFSPFKSCGSEFSTAAPGM